MLFVHYLLVLLIIYSIVMLCEAGPTKSHRSVEWTEIEPDAAHHQAVNEETVEWGDRAQPQIEHECTIHIKSSGKDKLESMLQEISDPNHPKYGKHLRKEEIDQILANPEGNSAIVTYLQSYGINITKQSSTTIHASGPLSAWEAALNTQFFNVKSSVLSDQTIYRARNYFLPHSIAKHVVMISNTVQLPVQMRRGPVILKKLPNEMEEK